MPWKKQGGRNKKMSGKTLDTQIERELPPRFKLERGRIVRLEELPEAKWVIFDFHGENSELANLKMGRYWNSVPTLKRDNGEIGFSLYEIFHGNIITKKLQYYKIIDKKSEEHKVYQQA